MIIGIGGTNGAGKDTVARLLVEDYGYLWIDATNMLVAELTHRGWPLDREHKSKLSAEWRREQGMGVVVDKALAAFQAAPAGQYKGLVVGSLRHPGEVDSVHEHQGKVIWIDADPELRYQRITNSDRGRSAEDNKTFEQFIAEEQREMTPSGDSATLNMAAVREKADITLLNNTSTPIELKKSLDNILNRL